MKNLKIVFLKDYEQFDEELLEFKAGQVKTMNEASAMHYVNRNVAELVDGKAKAEKPTKQESLPVDPPKEDPPKKDTKKVVQPKAKKTGAQKIKEKILGK